jgi:hypothetical protein
MARREVATRGKKPAARRRPATRSNLPILSRRECISWLLVAVAGLSLAGLRMHVIRLRYALGRAAREEQRLAARERAARATLAALRDPKRLTELARARGYGPPERILRVGERGPQR